MRQSQWRRLRRTNRIGFALIWLDVLLRSQIAMSADAPVVASSAPAPTIVKHVPLCPGLKVVTAVSQKDGDYESIKTMEIVTPEAQRMKYSSEYMTQDIFSTDPPKLERVSVYRQVLAKDQNTAIAYMEQFSRVLPEQIPGTTAIGASNLILKQLKSQPHVNFGFYQALVEDGGPLSASRSGGHPNVYDYQMLGEIHRVETTDVMLPVIVNDVPSLLPAVHAAGTFFGDKAEFFFLDDPVDPLTLKFRFGIDAVTPALDPEHPDVKPAKRDRDDLLVTKISFNCADAPSNTIEQQLSATGKADVYDIYFSFNSDQIRDESETSLKQIADALNDHADWKLAVNGHTDDIGGDAYNLTLSKRRAEAVKSALVGRLHIQPARLSTDGFGASQPKDTNATLQGRAHNRRVELIRR
jgi:outer membrane protein OmpA-like peptidoglycan-associated protein